MMKGYHRPLYMLPVCATIAPLSVNDTFDVRQVGAGLVPDPEGGPVDVALSAESLAFCFRHGFGLNTLQVNGRFEERRAGGLMRLRVHLTPAVMNSHGRSVPRSLLAPSFLRERARPVLARLRRQLG